MVCWGTKIRLSKSTTKGAKRQIKGGCHEQQASKRTLCSVLHRDVGALRLLPHDGHLHVLLERTTADVHGAGELNLRHIHRTRLPVSALRGAPRRQGPRLPAISDHGGGAPGSGVLPPFHGHDEHLLCLAGSLGPRQRPLQTEYLDVGRESLPTRGHAPGLGLQHLLHGRQRRCAALTFRRQLHAQALRLGRGLRHGRGWAGGGHDHLLRATQVAGGGGPALQRSRGAGCTLAQGIRGPSGSSGGRAATHPGSGDHVRHRHALLDGLPPERQHAGPVGQG